MTLYFQQDKNHGEHSIFKDHLRWVNVPTSLDHQLWCKLTLATSFYRSLSLWFSLVKNSNRADLQQQFCLNPILDNNIIILIIYEKHINLGNSLHKKKRCNDFQLSKNNILFLFRISIIEVISTQKRNFKSFGWLVEELHVS